MSVNKDLPTVFNNCIYRYLLLINITNYGYPDIRLNYLQYLIENQPG